MTIDENIADAVRQVATAKIAESFGGDVIEKIVTSVMNHRDTGYRSDNQTFIERLVAEQIKNILREVVRKHLETHRGDIESVVSGALTKHSDRIASDIVDAFVNDDWRANLNITVQREEHD